MNLYIIKDDFYWGRKRDNRCNRSIINIRLPKAYWDCRVDAFWRISQEAECIKINWSFEFSDLISLKIKKGV
jgi:hypothetical protein